MENKELCEWLRENSSGGYRPSAVAATRIEELTEVAKAMREWIDAVPQNVSLPAMPGFDRDWADEIIDS